MNDKASVFTRLLVFWLIQPMVMQFWVVNKSRIKSVIALLIFITGSMRLANDLHEVVEPSGDMSVIWTLFALMPLRYLHAVVVGGDKFAHHFGLDSFSRVVLFTLSVPTLVFTNAPVVAGSMGNSGERIRWIVFTALLGVVAMLGACHAVIYFQLDAILPEWAQIIFHMYLMCLSFGVGILLYELPIRLLLRLFRNDNVMIVPIVDNPILTTSPRDLWHRMTTCAGYHLRKGFYDPTQRKYNNKWLATACVFLINCLLHIIGWGYWMQGKFMVKEWIQLLVVFPLVTMFMQDNILGPKGLFRLEKASWTYRIANYLLLLALAIVALPLYLSAQLMPTSLHTFAIQITGTPSER